MYVPFFFATHNPPVITSCSWGSVGHFRPWTHTSDDSYIYQLSLVVATATVSFFIFSKISGRRIYYLFERSEFLIDTPHKKNMRVCPRARVK